MQLHYYPDTDSLCIGLADKPGAESEEVRPGVVLDFSAEGELVGMDIDHASRLLDLTTLETQSLPLQRTTSG